MVNLSRTNGRSRFFEACAAAANCRACANPRAASCKFVPFGSSAASLVASFGLLSNSKSVFNDKPLQPGPDMDVLSQEAPAITISFFRSFSCPIADIPSNGIARTAAITFIAVFIFFLILRRKGRQSLIFKGTYFRMILAINFRVGNSLKSKDLIGPYFLVGALSLPLASISCSMCSSILLLISSILFRWMSAPACMLS